MKLSFVLFALSISRLDLVSAFTSKSPTSTGRTPLPSAVHSTTVPQQGSAINVVNVPDDISVEDWTNNLLNGGPVDEDEENVLDVMQEWCQKKNVEGAEMVEKILVQLEDHVDAGTLPESRLRSYHYAIAVNAWAKSGHKDSQNKAEEIFNRMDGRNVIINRVVYNTLMNAHALQKDTKRVQAILNRMEEDCPEDMQTADYNALISSLARRGEALAAEEVVKNMVDRYYKGESECLPDGISYNIILDAWARSDAENCGTRAEMILDAIEQRDDSSLVEPNARSYVSVMWAVIRSGEKDIVKRVEAIWERAKTRGILKDPYVFTAFLEAYATEKPRDATSKVSKVLKEFEWINPTNNDKNIVYNAALKLLKESREDGAIAYAENLVEKMLSEGTADHVSYSTMIMMFANQKGDESLRSRVESLLNGMEDAGLQATAAVMNSVMNMWVRQGDLTRASSVLEQMEEAFRSGNNDLGPNVVSYTTLMNGWNKSGRRNKAEKTQEVFDKMMSMYESGNNGAEPNLVSYVTLVESIVKSKEDDVAERVEEIVREIYENYKSGKSSIKPNAQIVSTAINCWGQSGDRDAGERAEGLLNWLLDIYKVENDAALEPSEYCFAPAISAWAKSRKFGKVAKARAVLDKMISLHESGVIRKRPNDYCYTAVINACAYCENDSVEKRDALKIFVSTYKEITDSSRSDLKPNQITFSCAIAALRKLLTPSPERVAAVKAVFKKCCDEGMCDKYVLRRLRSTVDQNEWAEVVDGRIPYTADGYFDPSQIPDQWKKNVKR